MKVTPLREAESASDLGVALDIDAALGRTPATVHFSSIDDLLRALSPLLNELTQQVVGDHRGGNVDLTLSYDDGVVHVEARAMDHPDAPCPQTLPRMLTPLTEAELRVLKYLPTCLTFAAIADRCFVSRNTIKTQAIAIYRKLGVSSRHDAVIVAQRLALLPPGP